MRKYRKGQRALVPVKFRMEPRAGLYSVEPYESSVSFFVDAKEVRPFVTKRQLKEWFDNRYPILGLNSEHEVFKELCQLLGVR